MAIIDIHKTDRRYATILSDPPWPYNAVSKKMSGGLPYEPMTIDDIAALPVERLALDDCELWLWTTGPFIHEALHIVAAWGFEYKTKRVWAKSRAGTGYWLRGQTEDLLIATKGHPRRVQMRSGEQRKVSLSSLLLVTRQQRHSRKPRESYEDIEAVSGEPRLELFARRARPGWDSWGYEAKELDLELAEDFDEYIRRTR